jgi:threonine aldolase
MGPPPKQKRSFASDNNATIHPRILAAMADANVGHAFGYGADPWTERARAALKNAFGETASPYLVFNGTGANVVALSTLLRPYHAVICAPGAHINVDECGAPERFGGFKLVTADAVDGKLTPDSVERAVTGVGFEHHVQVKALSISQTTELGTVYSVKELAALAQVAQRHKLFFHLDGARLSNAAAAVGTTWRALTTEVGVDVVSLGGTKNGLMLGEAVVFLKPGLDEGAPYVRKQAMQLASKMRFVAAQFDAWMKDGLWLQLATHANAMGALLAAGAARVPGVQLTRPTQANAVFARIPPAWIPRLQEEFAFYVWDEVIHEVRWMCSHDTTPEDVNAFVALMERCARE